MSAPLPEIVCWRCMERPVTVPGELCTPCLRSEERRRRRLLAEDHDPYPEYRYTARHERSFRAQFASDEEEEAVLDDLAYRRWQDALDGHG